MIETFNGHYEYRDQFGFDAWCHLLVYEGHDRPSLIVAEDCPRSRGRSIEEAVVDVATCVFQQLMPYAREDFRWFERSATPGVGTIVPIEDVVATTFSIYRNSGGWQCMSPQRIATTKTAIEALIEDPLSSVSCKETDVPPHRFRTLDHPPIADDPWYLPIDTPIPVTFTGRDGQQVRAISKMERARRFKRFEQEALVRRARLLG